MSVNPSIWGPVNIKIRSYKKILANQLKAQVAISSTCIYTYKTKTAPPPLLKLNIRYQPFFIKRLFLSSQSSCSPIWCLGELGTPFGSGKKEERKKETLGFCPQEASVADTWLHELGDGLETVAFKKKKKSGLNHNWELTNVYPNQIKKRHEIIIINHSN